MSLAAFIADQRTSHGVPHALACRALEVSESWFYKWYDRAPTATDQRRSHLDAAVAEAFAAAHGLHGSPRIHTDLRATGWQVSEKSVAKSMARQGLVARSKKRRKNLTRPDRMLYNAVGVAPGDLQVGFNDNNVGDNGGWANVRVRQWQ